MSEILVDFKTLGADPYNLSRIDKDQLFIETLGELNRHHCKYCEPYAKIYEKLGFLDSIVKGVADIPFIPARLFKLHEMKSIPDQAVARTVTSSGTSSQIKSKIYLDREASFNQVKVLTAIITSYIGKKRLPLILLDSDSISRDPALYSVRGAGLMGFSMFGHDPLYALDGNMNLKTEALLAYLEKHQDEPLLMTGYTFIIWQHIIIAMEKAGARLNMANAFLFHGGGWKKLKDQAVSSQEFNTRLRNVLGNVQSYNYYGMAEQLGSIFVACEYGHLHCSNFSNVITRRAKDFSAASMGERGLLQVISLLPKSYPGHSLLTEDEGEILGEDDCRCGRLGKYFIIHGRVKNAELRGCGDTYERN